VGAATGDRGRPSSRLASTAVRLISIADDPHDDHDERLRKRVGVAAGYLTIVAPLGVPAAAPAPLLGWVVALGLSLFSVGNLLVLARTKRFERYVIALISSGAPFVLLTTILAGGVTTNSGGLVWAFLVPAYALLALGPRRATPWFGVFLATLLLAVLLDPLVGGLVKPPPYAIQLVFYVQNIGVPLTITFVLLRYTDLRRRAAEARSEELLTNALPASIAMRLKQGEARIADAYPSTTIVFADIVSFTPWSQGTDPARVVALLDDLFSRFDTAAAEVGIEKIKTIGDAYMAAAGAATAQPDHAEVAVRFGRAILAEAEDWSRAHGLDLLLRVGIASGPVVGGVIGHHRINFDLWGDTVNTAARMESSGVPGRIHLSASTRELLGGSHEYEERQVDVKGLGTLTTYLLVETQGLE
jgi:adenylate cyclase